MLGSSRAFIVAVTTALAWSVSGPLFEYSHAWQLAINIGTTIATLLMVFLIQNTQNGDSLAMQLKFDELLRAVAEARTNRVELESRSDEKFHRIQGELPDISQAEAAPELPDATR